MIRRILRFVTLDLVGLVVVVSLAALFSRRSRPDHVEHVASRLAAREPATDDVTSIRSMQRPRNGEPLTLFAGPVVGEGPTPRAAALVDAPSGLAALFPLRQAPSSADPVRTEPVLRLDWGKQDERRQSRP